MVDALKHSFKIVVVKNNYLKHGIQPTSIKLQRPKFIPASNIETSIDLSKYEQLVGIDPGVRSIFTSCNEDDRVLHKTGRFYRNDSKLVVALNKRQKWYKQWDLYDYWCKIP